jgi:hypothetical protein
MRPARPARVALALIAAAVIAQIVPLPRAWIETGYANGIYAGLARTFVPAANALPFTLGDALVVAALIGLIAFWVTGWRSGGSAPLRLGRLLLGTAAGAALIVIWFDAAWALNYRRVPVAGRVAFDPARLTTANVTAFSRTIVSELNATAPLAHADPESEAQLRDRLAAAFGPVARRLGDRYDVIVSRPKRTVFDWWFEAAGIGGSWVPFSYETVLNADLLDFERPFAIAHEWGHVAGFGAESDANYIGALTTLRSADPLIRYSGLFWAYGFLPEADRTRFPVSRLVRADVVAARRRFLRGYNAQLFALQWSLYDRYLRANRVAAGVASYSLFVQLLVGTPLDADGLPVARAPNG